MGGCVNTRLNCDLEVGLGDTELSADSSNSRGKGLNKVGREESGKEQRVVTNDELWKKGFNEQLVEAFCSGSLLNMSKAASLTYLSKNTSDSSFVTSPSVGFVEMMSFDGINKRVVNRYEIGLSMLKAQISHGADARALTTHGERSCLMFAVLAEDFPFVKELVELGVNINHRNSLGETALSLANDLKREDIADYLRVHGAAEESG